MKKINDFIDLLTILQKKFEKNTAPTTKSIQRCLVFFEIAKRNGQRFENITRSVILQSICFSQHTLETALKGLGKNKLNLIASTIGKHQSHFYLTQKGVDLKNGLENQFDIKDVCFWLKSVSFIDKDTQISRFEHLIFFLKHFKNDLLSNEVLSLEKYKKLCCDDKKTKKIIKQLLSIGVIYRSQRLNYNLTPNGECLIKNILKVINGHSLSEIPRIKEQRIALNEDELLVTCDLSDTRITYISKIQVAEEQEQYTGITADKKKRLKIYLKKWKLRKHLRHALKTWIKGTINDHNANMIEKSIKNSRLFITKILNTEN